MALATAGDMTPKQALTILTRIAARHPERITSVRQALGGERLALHASSALETAIETGDPIGRVLAERLQEVPDLRLASSLRSAIPITTEALSELAITVAQQLVDEAEEWVTADAAQQVLRVRLRNDLISRLLNAGMGTQAVAPAERNVAQAQVLVDKRDIRSQEHLAGALNMLAATLSNLRRHEDALVAAQRCFDIYRSLSEHDPETYAFSFADAANDLASNQHDNADAAAALATVDESLSVRQRLYDRQPARFARDLAQSLNTKASILSDLGRLPEAQSAAEQSVALFSDCFELAPDTYRADLLNSQRTLATVFGDQEMFERELALLQEVVNSLEHAYAQRPLAFLEDLTQARQNLAIALDQLEGSGSALNYMNMAIEGYQRLLARDGQGSRSDLIGAYYTGARIALHAGAHDTAVRWGEQALVELRAQPLRPQILHLTQCLKASCNLTEVLVMVGRTNRALDIAEQAVAMICTCDPTHRQARPKEHLTVKMNLALVHDALGDGAASIKAARTAAQLLPTLDAAQKAAIGPLYQQIERLPRELSQKFGIS